MSSVIGSGAPRLAYFVHDVADAAVSRRVRMLHSAGVKVTVIGFRRRAVPLDTINGARVVDLGQTGDGRFVQRIWAVLRNLAAFDTVRRAASDADVLMARNLETLVLAARAAKRRRLVYECLDIHRMLLTDGFLPRLVQRVEHAALGNVALIVTSSPRFADAYFRDRRGVAKPVLLAENKLPMTPVTTPQLPVGAVAGPPWVVGWFGMLRCKRSLAILAELAATSNGRVEVLIAGIPSDAEFSDFAETVEALPAVTFVGRYEAADLPALYGRVHFAWAIDYFEEGLNSTWLLPNRLYESLGYGAVPIALSSVETGAWLERNHVGLVIDTAEAAAAHLQGMSIPKYEELATAVAALPRATIELTAAENAEIVTTILGA